MKSIDPINRKRYILDLNAKLSMLRLEMNDQICAIDKINNQREFVKKENNIKTLLRRTTATFGVPPKLPVFKSTKKVNPPLHKLTIRKAANNPFLRKCSLIWNF